MNFIFTNIKRILFPVGLFLATFIIGKTLVIPILAQNFFSLSLEFGIQIGVWIFIGSLLVALSVGLWGKWEQYVFVAIPVSLGAALSVYLYNVEKAVTTFVVFLILFSYGIFKSNQLKNNLIKFSASFVLRDAVNIYTFLIAVLAGILVFATAQTSTTKDFGKKIATSVSKPIKNIVDSELKNSMLGGLPLPEGMDLPTGGLSSDIIDIPKMVEDKVNSVVEPYKNFILPLLALLMFAMIQFYTIIVNILFRSSIDLVFAFAKAIGFFKIETEMVEKQNLKF